MSMQNGTFVIGEFNQVKSEPWSTDATKFNHRIVLNNPYQDQYGNGQVEVITIDVSPEDLPIIQKQSSAIVGKQVMIPVVCQARAGGRNGAWLSRRMPKGSKIMMTPKIAEVA